MGPHKVPHQCIVAMPVIAKRDTRAGDGYPQTHRIIGTATATSSNDNGKPKRQ